MWYVFVRLSSCGRSISNSGKYKMFTECKVVNESIFRMTEINFDLMLYNKQIDNK